LPSPPSPDRPLRRATFPTSRRSRRGKWPAPFGLAGGLPRTMRSRTDPHAATGGGKVDATGANTTGRAAHVNLTVMAQRRHPFPERFGGPRNHATANQPEGAICEERAGSDDIADAPLAPIGLHGRCGGPERLQWPTFEQLTNRSDCADCATRTSALPSTEPISLHRRFDSAEFRCPSTTNRSSRSPSRRSRRRWPNGPAV
jgi:hypothetical protein